MSEETKKVAVSAPSLDGLSNDMIIKLLLQTQIDAVAANKALADALLESRKPWVDPHVIEQKRIALEEQHEATRKEFERRKNAKTQCPHVRDNGTSSINWMEHSNNIVKGVCSGCPSEFDARNPEDLKLLRANPKALKSMGRAGQHANNRFIGL
jgi:hypothetical protein